MKPISVAASAVVVASLLSVSAAQAVEQRSAGAAAAPVRFSRIQYDSPGSDTGSNKSLNAEWAKITNFSASKRTLTGWTVRDPQAHVYKFLTFTLGAGNSVKLHTGHGTNTKTDVYWRQDNYVWNNTGDKAILKNKAGTTVDTCKWGDGSGVINC
jgi:hypothetical protein